MLSSGAVVPVPAFEPELSPAFPPIAPGVEFPLEAVSRGGFGAGVEFAVVLPLSEGAVRWSVGRSGSSPD